MIDVRGIFPVWVAVEEDIPAEDRRRIGRAWFREVDPPYRRGQGMWLRLGHRALHIGVQHRTRARSDVDVLGREVDDVDGVVIGGWRNGPDVPQEDL